MSTAFRLLLLIVAASAALWMYRLRSGGLDPWFGRERGEPVTQAAPGVRRSPVEGVIGPREEEALVTIRGLEVSPPVRDGEWILSLPGLSAAVAGTDRWDDPSGLPPDGEELPYVEDLPDPWPYVVDDGDAWPEEMAGEQDGLSDAMEAPEGAAPAEGEPAEEARPEDTQQPAQPEPRVYRVEKGDNLWKIAKKFLGYGHRFPEIRTRDGGKLDPAKPLKPGTELLIPER